MRIVGFRTKLSSCSCTRPFLHDRMEHESQESSLSIDIRKNLACMRKLRNGLTCVFLPEADALAVTEEKSQKHHDGYSR